MGVPHPTLTRIASGAWATVDKFEPATVEVEENFVYVDEAITDLQSGAESHESRIAAIEGDSSDAMARVMNLQVLYPDLRALEMFVTTWTLLDQLTTAVSEVVAGDDSIDVDDTSTLQVGREYVIFDGTNAETFTCDSILSSTRLCASADFTHSYGAAAKIRRTDFDTSVAGQATAAAGSVYFAGLLNFGYDEVDKSVIIRREDNASDLRLYYQDTDHADWTEANWEWRREIETGIIDVEYRVPARGLFGIKVVVDGTEDVLIRHIAGCYQDTGLQGTHRPPDTPTNSSPADEAEDVMETPTLQAVAYSHPVGTALWASQIQISDAADAWDSPLHDSGIVTPGGLGVAVPAGVLAVSSTYFWRIRLQDVQGAWSEWSTPTSFSTSATFEYVVAPSNISPAAGATDVMETPTLSCSAFQVANMALISLSDGGTTDLWTDSGETSGEYYYTGAAIGHKPAGVYADGSLLTEGELGALSAGQWAWGNQDGLAGDTVYVNLTAGDPDAQAADYVQAAEPHEASQWQIRTATGNYTSPVYDSGAVSNLESHQVPAGVLQEGEAGYAFRVRHKGEHAGWSDWSVETAFTTKASFATIVGIALASTGGGAGTWKWGGCGRQQRVL